MKTIFLMEFKQYNGVLGLVFGYLAILAVSVGLAFVTDIGEHWVVPDGDVWQVLLYGGFGCCFVYGYICGGWEELYGNREFILHRSRSRAWFVGVRTFGAICGFVPLIVGFGFVPPLIARFIDPNGSLFQWSTWWHYWGWATILITSALAGAFAACVRARTVVRVVLGVGILVVVWSQASWLGHAPRDAWTRPMWQLVGAQAALGVMFVPGIVLGYLSAVDPDRPLRGARSLAQAIPCVVLALLGAAMLVSRVQHEVHGRYLRELRVVGAREVDSHHAESEHGAHGVGEPSEEGSALRSCGSHWITARQSPIERERYGGLREPECAVGGEWRELPSHDRSTPSFLAVPEGRVYALFLDSHAGSRRTPVLRVLEKGDAGGRFTAATHAVGADRGHGAVDREITLADPGDGTLWTFVSGDVNTEFRQLRLPNEDRYVGWHRRPGVTGGVNCDLAKCVIVGERGAYLRDGDGWVDATESHSADAKSPFETRFNGPLDLTVTVPPSEGASDGSVHRYVPRTALEHLREWGLYGLSLWRSPIAYVASFAKPASPEALRSHFFRSPVWEPLLLGGKRAWLLAVLLVNVLVCGVSAYRRLRRLGADRSVGVFWCASIVLVGIPALILYFLMEPRSVYNLDATDEPLRTGPAEPLIRSPRIATRHDAVETVA